MVLDSIATEATSSAADELSEELGRHDMAHQGKGDADLAAADRKS
jgi:hypothetical protein